MGILIWGVVCFLTGFVGFLAPPIIVGPMLPLEHRKRYGDLYFAQAFAALRRGMIMRRLHSGYELVASSFDGEKSAEKVALGDANLFYRDFAGKMSRAYKYPFGLVTEKKNTVVDPKLAEVGELEQQRVENGEHLQETRDGFVANTTLSVPKVMRIVDVAAANAAVPKSASPKLPETVEDYIQKSQQGFNTKSVIDMMAFITAFGVGFGLMWLAAEVGTTAVGGGGGSVTMPMVITVGGLL